MPDKPVIQRPPDPSGALMLSLNEPSAPSTRPPTVVSIESLPIKRPSARTQEPNDQLPQIVASCIPSTSYGPVVLNTAEAAHWALQDVNDQALRIFSLLHQFTLIGQPIDAMSLRLGASPRFQWSSEGYCYYLDAATFGMQEDLARTLNDEHELNKILDLLEAKGLTSEIVSSDKTLLVSNIIGKVDEPVAEAGDWKQAVLFASFFFSGCDYSLECGAKSVLPWKLALPRFQALLDRHQSNIDSQLAAQIIPALLQASKFSTQDWKLQAIAMAEKMGASQLEAHVRAYFAYRKSLILRINRNTQAAEQAIQAYFANSHKATDSRLHAIHGFLQHSLAWLAFERGEFPEALKHAADWAPHPSQPSLYEARVDLKLRTITGVIHMHMRNYRRARSYFQLCLDTYDVESRARQSVLAHAIDTCCELEDFDEAYKLSTAELKRLHLEPSEVTVQDLDDSYLRDVLISIAELYLRSRYHQEATQLLRRLEEFYDRLTITAQKDQQRHVKVLILLAQCLHQRANDAAQWNEVLKAWDKVLQATHRYSVVDQIGWDSGMIAFSMYHVNTKLGSDDRAWLETGKKNFAMKDHFWICGMSTHWLGYILKHVDEIPDHTKQVMLGL
jgi:tetratricopeptide (TPR) repeat protein